jgi:outer membrane receptor protein involved in Fe transport
MYVSNDNVGTYDGYDVVDATVFYTIPGNNGRSTRWYLEVSNILDEKYADGPGGANGDPNPTTVNARPPASVYGGVIITL